MGVTVPAVLWHLFQFQPPAWADHLNDMRCRQLRFLLPWRDNTEIENYAQSSGCHTHCGRSNVIIDPVILFIVTLLISRQGMVWPVGSMRTIAKERYNWVQEYENWFLRRGRDLWVLLCKQHYILQLLATWKWTATPITATSNIEKLTVTWFSSIGYQVAVIDITLISKLRYRIYTFKIHHRFFFSDWLQELRTNIKTK